MLEQACAQLAAWSHDLGHDWLQVAVNIPPHQVVDLDLPAQLADAIARHGLSAHQLVVEITEDGLLTDLDAARRVTHELREPGSRWRWTTSAPATPRWPTCTRSR